MTYLVIVLLMALGYGYFFYSRSQVKKKGGFDAHFRAKTNQTFRMSGDEQVTAAWSAVTVPKLSAGEKAVDVAGAVAAAVVGVGVQMVGRQLGIACTTKNRVLLFDKENDEIRAFGPEDRPHFAETGKKGTKRASQTRMGFDEGAIVALTVPGGDVIEIDVVATAVPVLVAWSRGESVATLAGPIPIQGVV